MKKNYRAKIWCPGETKSKSTLQCFYYDILIFTDSLKVNTTVLFIIDSILTGLINIIPTYLYLTSNLNKLFKLNLKHVISNQTKK